MTPDRRRRHDHHSQCFDYRRHYHYHHRRGHRLDASSQRLAVPLLLWLLLLAVMSIRGCATADKFDARLTDCEECFAGNSTALDKCRSLFSQCRINVASPQETRTYKIALMYEELLARPRDMSADLYCQGFWSLALLERGGDCDPDLGARKDLVVAGVSYFVRDYLFQKFNDHLVSCTGWTFSQGFSDSDSEEDDGSTRPLRPPATPPIARPFVQAGYVALISFENGYDRKSIIRTAVRRAQAKYASHWTSYFGPKPRYRIIKNNKRIYSVILRFSETFRKQHL